MLKQFSKFLLIGVSNTLIKISLHTMGACFCCETSKLLPVLIS